MKKGKYLRSAKQETDELEQAFLQVTHAANGDRPGATSDSCYSETIVLPKAETGKPVAGRFARKKQSSPVVRQNRRRTAIALSVTVAVLLLCLGVGIWFYLSATADDGLIMANTYTAGINIGGMTPEDAVIALRNATNQGIATQNIVVSLPDATLTLTPAETRLKLDIDALVDDAYRHGCEGKRIERVRAMAAAALTRYDIDLLSYISVDTTYIKNAIAQLLAQTATSLTQPTIQVSGDRPTATIPDGARPENGSEETIDPTTTVYQTLTITLGTQGRSFDTETVYNQVMAAYNSNTTAPIAIDYQIEEPQSVDLDALVETYCSDSVDAQLDEIAYTVSDEVWGYGFDVAAAKTWLQSAPYGQTLSLPLTYQAPAITRPALEATLFPDVLAAAQTHYYYHPERTTNLVVACRTINQLIIKPGETFSFNDTLGQRTEEKGYQPAGAYAGGQTVLQVGGGICQVASTLYYCTLYADLEVLEREEHMYTSDYLPLGMDATVNWGTIDFRFRNNTDHPIRIEAKAEDGYVTVTLMGTDDKTYYIEMDYKVIKEYPWKTVEKEMEADNEEGYVDGDVILSGWTGYSVDTYKYKYDKQTDELISKTIESHSEYESRDKQICRIRQDETLPPETTIPPETTLPPETTVAPETDTSDPAA